MLNGGHDEACAPILTHHEEILPMIHENNITRAIIESYMTDWCECLDVDVCVAGAGPAGMWLSKRLADAGLKTVLLEKKLSLGGGIWGGGMMLNRLVFQPEAKPIFDEMGIQSVEHSPGHFVANTIECTAALALSAARAGARIFNLMAVEDLIVREGRVTGVVTNWTAVQMAQLHIDPMCMSAKAVVDATGHQAELAHLAAGKGGLELNTETGGVVGEKSMWAVEAEEHVVESTGEICPGLYVAGMAATAVRGGYRMGPIFGGMLMSADKAAKLIAEALKG